MSEFDQVIGYDEIKNELLMLCDILKNPIKYQKLGVEAPKGIIMEGNPGVGKTLLATCFIKESGLPYFVCRKNRTDGEFTKNIEETFEKAAKNEPSIVFLDDIDKFSNEDAFHPNSDAFVTVQSCIDEYKKNKIFVIATSNNNDCMPDSLLRSGRLEEIKVNNPTGKEAEKIIGYYLSKKNNVGDLDNSLIAKILCGGSCADLETVINKAGLYAGFASKEKIDMDDIIKSCLRTLYNAPSTIQNEGKTNNEETIYHEVGHAVIGEILEPGSVTLISVQKNTGNIKGFTSFCRSENYWGSFALMENRVITLLGGKAITEIKYGKYDTGCSSDLDRAYKIVDRMITNYGINGFNRLDHHYPNMSEKVISGIEDAIGELLAKYYIKAKEIIVNNLDLVNGLVDALKEKDTITLNDIQVIKQKCKIAR